MGYKDGLPTSAPAANQTHRWLGSSGLDSQAVTRPSPSKPLAYQQDASYASGKRKSRLPLYLMVVAAAFLLILCWWGGMGVVLKRKHARMAGEKAAARERKRSTGKNGKNGNGANGGGNGHAAKPPTSDDLYRQQADDLYRSPNQSPLDFGSKRKLEYE